MLKVAGSVLSGMMVYQGTWDALTNSPPLASGIGIKGQYYVVSVAGNTDLDGITDWQVGDWAVFNGTAWQKVDNSETVVSVNGQTGAVVLTAADVGATPNTTFVLAGGLLSGGGQLNANVTLSLTDVPFANVTGAGTMASQNANSVSITGGSIDGTTIGGSSPANGSFTQASATNVTISNNATFTSLTGYVYANNTGVATAATTIPVADVNGAVPNTVNILAGTGISGGGALTGNVTITNAGVTDFNGRTGNVSLSNTDVINALGYTPGSGNGTVSNVATGTGLTGGPITTTGTISIANTAVTPGDYGNASAVGTFSVNQQGQITAASNASIAIDVSQVTNAVPTSRTVTAGTGLNGGGNLASNITINQTANSVQQLIGVENNGVLTGVRQAINFKPGSNITFSTTDDAINGRVDVNVSVSGLGTMATQNADSVAITGGTINNTSQLSGTYSNANISSVSSTFPNSYLANSNVTINGTTIDLGGSGTITANGAGTLTFGTGLDTGSYNGSANVTINLANTAVAAGTYGSNGAVSQVVIDAQGRITSASNVAITIPSGNVSGLGTMATQNANNVNITGGTADALTLSNANISATTANTAAMPDPSLPLNPEGYITVSINGTNKKIPYYEV